MATQRYHAIIHAYCLMSNHYHLLIETPEGNLSQIMQHINGSYTTYYNVKRKRAGHLFQGRYSAILIDADAYALELSRYIHLNPVRAGMVEHPGHHPWSSYCHYVNGKDAPEWLQTRTILAQLSQNEEAARGKYRQFVQDRLGDTTNPLKGVAAGTFLGSELFIDAIREKYLSGRNADRNLPKHRALTTQRSISQIVEKVASKNFEHALARKAAIYLCHRYSGEKLRNIGEYFQLSESGVTQASRRFSERQKEDGALFRQVQQIVEELGLCNV